MLVLNVLICFILYLISYQNKREKKLLFEKKNNSDISMHILTIPITNNLFSLP